MLPALTLLLVFTATFRPAHPHVGDPIVIDFPTPVAVDSSPHYEVLTQSGSRAVVRTFEPRPFSLSGRSGDVAFRNLVVPVESVLKSKDDVQPSPLVPPVVTPYPRIVTPVLAATAGLAALVWLAVILLARRAVAEATMAPSVPPDQRYRLKVAALRDSSQRIRRWAELADATRSYLAAIDPMLGAELTTTDVEQRLEGNAFWVRSAERWPAHGAATVMEILRQGDLEKFSPWGASPADFVSLANRALELAPEPQKAAEEAA
jgi:hypothetical protein